MKIDWSESEIISEEEVDNELKLSNIKVEPCSIKVAEVFKGYKNSEKDGTVAYDGKLNIRPPYQREFIYTHDQEQAVIRSVIHNFPLSLIYWGKNDDGTYEMIDGQQRTLSILRFLEGKYSITIDGKIRDFDELSDKIKERILNYDLSVIKFTGEPDEKLVWFEIINTVGEKLNKQELLNASYHGTFVTDARKHFSNIDSDFFNEKKYGKDYTNFLRKPKRTKNTWETSISKKSVERQQILEKVLSWVSGGKDEIESYLHEHRMDKDSKDLKDEVIKILKWSTDIFCPEISIYESWMGETNWGKAYYINESLPESERITKENSSKIFDEFKKLVKDEEITNPKGIVLYLVSGNEKYLSIRAFDKKDSRKRWLYQDKKCAHCSKSFDFEDMEADHITPWSKGGKTDYENLQMLCVKCNNKKSSKNEISK